MSLNKIPITLFIGFVSFLFWGCSSDLNIPFKQGYKNIMTDPVSLTSENDGFIESQGLNNVNDENAKSKFLVDKSENWIKVVTDTIYSISYYTMTSADDAPGRDPKNWTLEGSNDGDVWIVIDEQENQLFTKRGQTKSYTLKNGGDFSHFKFNMQYRHTSIYGDDFLQIGEIGLFAITKLPISEFVSPDTKVKITEWVQFIDSSANAPNEWLWKFDNGTPSESEEQNPKVVFDIPGGHDVTLITKNKFGTDTVHIKNYVTSYDPQNPWDGFIYPTVILNPSDTTSNGYVRVKRLIPDMEKEIEQIILGVVKILYLNITEVPTFDEISFCFQWSDVLAAKGGTPEAMQLWFSTKYIENTLSGKPDNDVLYEIRGVLWHELTHAYQFSPNTKNNVYEMGTDFHSCLEGVADFVRIRAGYHRTRRPDLGINDNKYLSGYTTTGFFLEWVTNNYDEGFIYKFNQSAKELDNWSFKIAFENILDKDIDSLWYTYCDYVNQQNIDYPISTKDNNIEFGGEEK